MFEMRLVSNDRGGWYWVDPVGCQVGKEFCSREYAILWGEHYFQIDLGEYYEDQS